jgi:predicted outer membrane protein
MKREEEDIIARKIKEEYLHQMQSCKDSTMNSIRRYLLSSLSEEELKKFSENLLKKNKGG